MRDVAAAMVPPGNTPIDLASHLRFLEHMAMLHAAFWEWDGELELLPLAHHYLFLTPAMAAAP